MFSEVEQRKAFIHLARLWAENVRVRTLRFGLGGQGSRSFTMVSADDIDLFLTLPIGPKVVPFWDYLLEF